MDKLQLRLTEQEANDLLTWINTAWAHTTDDAQAQKIKAYSVYLHGRIVRVWPRNA